MTRELKFFRILDEDPIICRVCGRPFKPKRSDALTCSDACRQDLHRGKAFAYCTPLAARERRREQRYHAKRDAEIAAMRQANADYRTGRKARREQRATEARDRVLVEVLGRKALAQLRQHEAQQHQKFVATVAGIVKFFAQERREITYESITTFCTGDCRLSITKEQVAAALAELRAEGEIDRILAEASTRST